MATVKEEPPLDDAGEEAAPLAQASPAILKLELAPAEAAPAVRQSARAAARAAVKAESDLVQVLVSAVAVAPLAKVEQEHPDAKQLKSEPAVDTAAIPTVAVKRERDAANVNPAKKRPKTVPAPAAAVKAEQGTKAEAVPQTADPATGSPTATPTTAAVAPLPVAAASPTPALPQRAHVATITMNVASTRYLLSRAELDLLPYTVRRNPYFRSNTPMRLYDEDIVAAASRAKFAARGTTLAAQQDRREERRANLNEARRQAYWAAVERRRTEREAALEAALIERGVPVPTRNVDPRFQNKDWRMFVSAQLSRTPQAEAYALEHAVTSIAANAAERAVAARRAAAFRAARAAVLTQRGLPIPPTGIFHRDRDEKKYVAGGRWRWPPAEEEALERAVAASVARLSAEADKARRQTEMRDAVKERGLPVDEGLLYDYVLRYVNSEDLDLASNLARYHTACKQKARRMAAHVAAQE
jgi:hypothetical protein